LKYGPSTTPGAIRKLNTALKRLMGEGFATALSKMLDSRANSADHTAATAGFHVEGGVGGILRALEMMDLRKGRISSKVGSDVKVGGESLARGGAAMKEATGSCAVEEA
jgi:hypothetical protein